MESINTFDPILGAKLQYTIDSQRTERVEKFAGC